MLNKTDNALQDDDSSYKETIPDNVLVGRQPIFTPDLEIHAYELLFRDDINKNTADVIDGDFATSQLILNAFFEIGAKSIVGSKPAFVNLTRNFILGEQILAINNKQVVLEILEDVEVDLTLINRVELLKAKGYVFALDDFSFDKKYEELIRHIDIIKIDIMSMSGEEIRKEVERLKPYGVKLLAEKIENLEEFNHCKSLGIDYFQGYFLSKPNIVKGARIPGNRLSTLTLLRKLHDETTEISEIEQSIKQDVSLSYRLLKYINSSYYGFSKKIESINHALVLLGIDKIRQWVTIISLARLNDKPTELIISTLVRARMCENIAKICMQKKSSTYFLVGLFSNLDALMDANMEDLLNEIPLSNEAKAAILNMEGEMGDILRNIIEYEHGNWDALQDSCVDDWQIKDAYIDALTWANETLSGLNLNE